MAFNLIDSDIFSFFFSGAQGVGVHPANPILNLKTFCVRSFCTKFQYTSPRMSKVMIESIFILKKCSFWSVLNKKSHPKKKGETNWEKLSKVEKSRARKSSFQIFCALFFKVWTKVIFLFRLWKNLKLVLHFSRV